MTDIKILQGGAPTDSKILVNVDQATIEGNGSIDNPIRVVGDVLTLEIRFVTSTAIIASDDYLLVDTTAPRVITLPNPALTPIKEFILKDVSGQSETNAIALTRFGGEEIEGLASNRELRNNFGVWRVLNDGTNWWLV